jgi:thiamine-phosphate diphosphorylase
VILHLVTALNRLSPANPHSGDARSCLMRQIGEAIDAGVDVVQIRERALEAAELASIVVESVKRAKGTTTRIVVNDRVDVAMACGASGVHLRGDSLPTEKVRALVPRDFLIGRSVHAISEAVLAGPVDYLIAGTVWPTTSKSAAALLLGPEGLVAIVSAVNVPVLAIGGVTGERLPALVAAGAAGAAGIELFLGDATTAGGCRAVPLREHVARLRRLTVPRSGS